MAGMEARPLTLPHMPVKAEMDSRTSSTSAVDCPGLMDAAADQKSHHLLKHCLSTGQRDGALAHFASDDVKEAAREVSRMGQRELQARFKAVYGTTTHSNNNDWLRRKLYEAIGAAPMKAALKSKPRRAGGKARRGASAPSSPAARAVGCLAARSHPGTPAAAMHAAAALRAPALISLDSPELSFSAEEGSETGSYSYMSNVKAGSGGTTTPQSVLSMLPERSSWSRTELPTVVVPPAASAAELVEAVAPVVADWASAAEGLDLEALRGAAGFGECPAQDDDVMLLSLDLSVFE